MNRHAFIWIAVLLCLVGLASVSAQAAPSPRLLIQPLANQKVFVTWTNDGSGLALEQSAFIGSPTLWQPIQQTPLEQNNQFSVTVDASIGNGFFRLHGPPLTSIRASSPVNGETGVAVLRETIVHFTSPLNTSAVVTTNNFYAGYGGRRLLSRVELSSDRTKATLFYLEPMPGSTRVVAVFDGAGLTDSTGRPIDPDGDGQAGGAALIAFDTLNLTALAGTAVIGRVFASELMPGSDTGTNAVNRPLEGVTITVDGREQDLRTTTDALGNFTLTPAPPGRFFVKIDGRTAKGSQYPNGAYYPYVGKAWDAVAGRTNNLAGGTGEIYLPLITAGTLQPVSMISDTTISFPASVVSSNPALAGVSITVPANSLFSDDGMRGGKVGIAPVPPDRLPGPLPPGLELPIVITVQSDGPLNFDKPASICFPNLPDPVLGVPLPAGSKQALISFNHKKGIWEGVGSMTVSADGKLVCTDPGVGILQPGWNGVGPRPLTPPRPGPLPNCAQPPCNPPPPPPPPPPCPNPPCNPPPPPPPPPPPCNGDPDVNACLNNCFLGRDVCDEQIRRFLLQKAAICEAIAKAHGKNSPEANKCDDETWLGGIDYFQLCSQRQLFCVEGCKSCISQNGLPPNATPGPTPTEQKLVMRTDDLTVASSLQQDVLISQQIDALYDQIIPLVSPYVLAGMDVPSTVLDQVHAIRAQADALAGGDAEPIFTERVIQLEDAIAAGSNGADLDPGNAPGYPVMYVATIKRPNDFFFVRGETEPYGQYQIFVPRDGELLDVRFYDPRTKGYGRVLPNLSPKSQYSLPRFTLYPMDSIQVDSDHDGLPDLVEYVYGTDPKNADTDGDGIPDGAEAEQGTNPLDGLPAQTGIIATVKTPGIPVDVCTINNLAVLAELDAGVSVYNIFNGMSPKLVAQVDTPGSARRVACSGNFVAVADDVAGLAVIDISDSPSARVVHQVDMGGTAQSVAVAGNLAYVAVGSEIVLVDMPSGTELDRRDYSGGAIHDMSIDGDYLYTVSVIPKETEPHTIHKIRIGSSLGPAEDTLIVSGHATFGTMHLFAGGGFLYVGAADNDEVNFVPGIEIISDSDTGLRLVGPPSGITAFNVVANGTGLALYTGADAGLEATAKVGLLDVRDPTKTDRFVTRFDTPGAARAISIFNGLAYVATGDGGLQVINYLAYDNKGVPPIITLQTDYAPGLAEVGKPMHVVAKVMDDVQVRQVEFYVDGALATAAGRFPFEAYLAVPGLTATKTNFTLRARANDTGGNSTWSTLLTLALVSDATRPQVTGVTPADQSIASAASTTSIIATFSEPIKPATLSGQTFQLFSAGPDGVAGNADDVAVPGGTTHYRTNDNSASLDFSSPLPAGLYRAVLRSGITDLAANALADDFAWSFRLQSPAFWAVDASGLWQAATNWNTRALPQTNDLVVIDRPGKDVTVTLEPDFQTVNLQTVYSLLSQDAIVLSGGTLALAQPSEVNNMLTLSGGTLSVATELTISGPLIWMTQGTLDGGGVTLANGGITIPASNDVNNTVFIGNQTLNNAGLATWSSRGGILFTDPFGVINNLPGATFDVQNDADEVMASQFAIPPFPQFNNAGTFVKSAGTNTTLIRQVAFNNSGVAEVRQGTLNLAGGGNSHGAFKIDADSVLQFGSGHDLRTASSIGGEGNVVFNSGTITVGGTYDVTGGTTIGNSAGLSGLGATVIFDGAVKHADGSFVVLNGSSAKFNGNEVAIQAPPVIDGGIVEFNAPDPITLPGLTVNSLGTVKGLSDIIVSGPLVLTNAVMSGPGRTIAKAGLQISGHVTLYRTAGFDSVDPRNIDNFSLATWTGAASLIDLGRSNVFNNLAGATMDVQTDAGFGGDGSSVFNNAGTFLKSAGNGTMPCGVLFQNSGTVELRSGSVNFTRGFVQTDGATRLSGGNIQAFPSFAILGGSLSGSGSIDVFAFTNAASISPGASAGLLTFKGNYTQTATGSLNIEIGGASPGTGFDQITVSNAATLGGALDIALINGYQPNLGDTFAVLTCGSRTGTFATVNGLIIGNGKQFQVNYGNQGVTLSVVAAP